MDLQWIFLAAAIIALAAGAVLFILARFLPLD